MANVNEVKVCSNCDTALPFTDMEKCPSCGTLLRLPENDYFSTPDYLTMQLSDHIVDLKEAKGKSGEPLEADANKIYMNYFQWLKVIPSADASAAFRDCRSILQHALLSNMNMSTVRLIVTMGKDIGKLAEAVEAYLSSGGQIINHDHLKIPETPVTNENQDEPKI